MLTAFASNHVAEFLPGIPEPNPAFMRALATGNLVGQVISIDYESQSCCNIMDSSHLYATDPSTRLQCAVFGWFATTPQGTIVPQFYRWVPGLSLPQWLVDYVNNGGMFAAFNATFERLMWNNVATRLYGWPPTKLTQWYCTAAACATLATPKRLEHVATFLALSTTKDEEGGKLMKKYAGPDKKGNLNTPTPEHLAKIVDYCEQDVKVEMNLQYSTRPMQPSEYRVWLLDQVINDRGVYADLELAESALKMWEVHEEIENERFRSITGGVNATQVAVALDWINSRLPVENRIAAFSKDILVDLLPRVTDPAVIEAINIRLDIGSAAVKKFPRFLQCAASDHRIRGVNRYHGAATGRWAGRLVQLQNMMRGIFKHDWEIKIAVELVKRGDLTAIKALWGNAGKVLGSLCRPTLRAAPGSRFLVSDFSQIEARVVAWLAGAKSLVEQFRLKQDPYYVMATRIYPGKEIAKKGTERELGKRAVLGCGFGMGAKKFKDSAKREANLDIEFQLAKRCVDTYRATYPEIPRYWRLINDAAIAAVNSRQDTWAGLVRFRVDREWLYAVLPSGRELAYYKPRIDWDHEFNRPSLSYMGVDGQSDMAYRERTYGGKLTENVVQAIARDIMVETILKLEARGYATVFSVHDEVIFEMPIGEGSLEEVESVMRETVWFAPDLPVEAKGFETLFYKKG
jgi:DNA polymerase bacteriophage-type